MTDKKFETEQEEVMDEFHKLVREGNSFPIQNAINSLYFICDDMYYKFDSARALLLMKASRLKPPPEHIDIYLENLERDMKRVNKIRKFLDDKIRQTECDWE